MKIAEAFVDIRIDKGQAQKEAKSAAESAMSSIRQVFAAGVFIKGIQESISQASDLNETVSKTKVIFGDSGAEIERWSTNSARQFGVSQRAALDAASTFATFGKSAGLAGADLTGFSQQLVGLSSDLASFYNTSPEQAITAIGAALRGESEPIRQYGVLLDDATLKARALSLGVYDGTGNLTQQARVLAAQAEILAQTSDAQGDFARTADGLANSQRIAKAESENAAASLGQSFLPVYQRIVTVVGEGAKVFGELPAGVQTGVVALAGLVAFSGPIGKVGDAISGVRSALTTSTGAVSNFGKAAGAAGAAVGILGGAVAALAIFDELVGRTGDVTDEMNALLAATTNANGGTADLVNRFADLVSASATTQSSIGQFSDLVGAGFDDTTVRADAMAEAFDKVLAQSPEVALTLAESLGKVVDSAEAGSEGAANFAEGWGLSRDVVAAFTTKANNAKAATEALGTSAATTAPQTQDLATATDDAADAAERLEQATRDAASAVDDAYSGQFRYRDAVKRVEDAFVQLVLKRDAAQKDPTPDNVRALDDAVQDLEESFQNQAQAAADVAVQQAALNGNTLTASERTQAQIDELLRLRDSVAPGSELARFLDGYVEQLLKVPGTIDTRIDVDAAEALRIFDLLISKASRYKGLITDSSLRNAMEGRGATGPTGQTGLQTAGKGAGSADTLVAGGQVITPQKASEDELKRVGNALGIVGGQLAKVDAAKAVNNRNAQILAEAEIKRQDALVEAQYKAGTLSLDAYRTYLQRRSESYEAYSAESSALLAQVRQLNDTEDREIERLQRESDQRQAQQQREADKAAAEAAREAADAEEKRLQDELDRQEAAHQAYLDRVEEAYRRARARRAFAEAADEVDKAIKELDAAGTKAGLYSLDPKRTAEERAAANAEYQAAQDRAASALEDRARAGAQASGIQDGTEAFAQAVRDALRGDAANAPALADEISKILLGYDLFPASTDTSGQGTIFGSGRRTSQANGFAIGEGALSSAAGGVFAPNIQLLKLGSFSNADTEILAAALDEYWRARR